MDLITVVAICYFTISFIIVLTATISALHQDIKKGIDFTILDFIIVIFVLLFSWWMVWYHLSEMKILSRIMGFTLIKGKK